MAITRVEDISLEAQGHPMQSGNLPREQNPRNAKMLLELKLEKRKGMGASWASA